MKKKIYAGLAGLLLLGSLTAVASAATSTLIGKKVQSVVAFTVNGKSVKDAVVIDGTTYVPARAFAEANGAKIAVEGGKVKMTTGTSQSSDNDISKQLNTKYQIQVLQNNISFWKVTIEGYDETIAQAQAAIDEAKKWNATAPEGALEMDTSSAEKKLADAQAEKAETQAKIDAANAEIAQLQAQLNE